MGRLLSATSVLGLVDYWKGVNRLYKFLGTILYLMFSFKKVFFGRYSGGVHSSLSMNKPLCNIILEHWCERTQHVNGSHMV